MHESFLVFCYFINDYLVVSLRLHLKNIYSIREKCSSQCHLAPVSYLALTRGSFSHLCCVSCYGNQVLCDSLHIFLSHWLNFIKSF